MQTKRRATSSERAYMEKVAGLCCACCGAQGVHVHHIREGQGMSQRASNGSRHVSKP